MLHQAALMELAPSGKQGGGRSDAEGAPQVAHQVEDAGGIAHLHLGDAGHGEGGEGHEGGAQAKALDEPGPPGGGEIDRGSILAHEINGTGVDHQTHKRLSCGCP